MSGRAVILGLLLALLVASFTYFNDAVIQQTPFIGNFLPVSVFGIVVVLGLAVNPLLARVKKNWALRSGELMLVTALGLAACGWPGSGLYRTFATALALPGDMVRNKTGWQAAGVMSYVPDGSPMLADAHVRGVGRREAAQSTGGRTLGEALRADDAGAAATQVWRLLSETQRALITSIDDADRVPSDERARVIEALNETLMLVNWVETLPSKALPDEAVRWLETRDALLEELAAVEAELEALRETTDEQAEAGRVDALRARARSLRDTAARSGLVLHAERMANRWALASALPAHVLPPPQGHGVLPAHGLADPWVTDGLLVTRQEDKRWPWDALPWRVWAPSLYRWTGLLLLFGLMATCLAMIVHPQWSRRELLPYPLVSFVSETVERGRDAQGRPGILPAIFSSKLFWIGVASMFILHGVNGLHQWFNAVPEIRTSFDLTPARAAIPGAEKVPTTFRVFYPILYPSVIAFTFFLTLSVGFSMSLSMFAWLLLGIVVIGSGASFGQGFYDAKEGNLLRFGSFVAMVLVIAYTGRRYYLSVALGTVGWNADRGATPRAAVWAGRALVLLGVLSVWWLQQAGLGWGWAVVLIVVSLGIWLVMARVVAETGCFYVQPGLIPVGVLAALLGHEAMGPTGLLLIGLASMIVIGDQREAVLPFIVHSLKFAERKDASNLGANESAAETQNESRARRRMPSLGSGGVMVAGVVVASLLIAGVVTLTMQYALGLNNADWWGVQWFPEMAWNDLTRRVQDMSADGTLIPVAWGDWTQRFSMSLSAPGAWGWTTAGFVALLVCAAARLRLPWWPIHPVLFLVWGTTPMERFAWSFVLGWLCKLAVVKLAGANGYRAAKPLMVGVIAGELIAALVWTAVGVTYYLTTGTTPSSYIILPQ